MTSVAPTFQRTSSIASRIIGETPVIQRTTAIHASHEMLRSTVRTQRTPGKVRLRTRTLRRMTTSEIRIGIATLNTAGLTVPASTTRAAYARASARTGKRTPSKMLLPNQTEATGRSRPRSRRTMIQAATRQPTRIASSATAPGLNQLGSELVELAGVEGPDHGRAPGRPKAGRAPSGGSERSEAPAGLIASGRAGARRRCARARRGCSRLRGTTRCGRRRACRRAP